MKTVLTLTLLLISFALPTASSQPKPQQNILAISHVTVIDATGAPPKPNMTVIITGDRITQIAKKEEVVVVGGRLIPKVSLDKMLLDVERAANRN